MARDGQGGQDGQQGQWPGDGGGWRPPEWEGGQNRNGQRGYQPGATQSYSQPAPPTQAGQWAYGSPPAQPPYGPPPPPRGKSWPARHKALTGVLGLAALIIIIAAVGAGGSPGSRTPTGLTTPATATATGTPVKQATQAATVTRKALPAKTQAVPAASRAPATLAPAAVTHAPPAPAPSTRAAVAPPPATQAAVAPPASAAAPAACSPLTNGGKCYEPGETCRNADHGVSGVAGDGKAITCENNDGWRWEPS